MNELMCVVVDLYAHGSKLGEQALDLLFPWVATHVAKIFVLVSSQNFVYDAREFVGDGDLGFVLGTQPKAELAIL
jgi:hypothetical protein